MNEPRGEYMGPAPGASAKHPHDVAAPASPHMLYPPAYKNFNPAGSYAVTKPYHDGSKRQMLARTASATAGAAAAAHDMQELQLAHGHHHSHGPRGHHGYPHGYGHNHGARGLRVDAGASTSPTLDSPSLPGLSMLLREPQRGEDFMSPRSPAGDFMLSPRAEGPTGSNSRLVVGKAAPGTVAPNRHILSYQQFLQGASATPSTTSGSSEDDPEAAPRAASGARHLNAQLNRQQQLTKASQQLQELQRHQTYDGAMDGKPPRATAAPVASTPAEDQAPVVAAPASEQEAPPAAPATKSSRYLREMDRRAILSRIASGEKQSALAKEYQVSRAAICNLNKHRDEVLSRKDSNPLAKHPKKPRPKNFKNKLLAKNGWASAMALGAGAGTGKAGVHEIKSRAAALLLTTLRKKHTAMSEFRRSSDRLMRLVMEEALAHVPVKTVEIFLTNQVKSDGVALEHPPCAISMEPAGCPMLDLFHLMEPDQPTGYVSFGDLTEAGEQVGPSEVPAGGSGLTESGRRELQVTLFDARLPPSLNYHNVFLVDHVVSSGELVCAVVRRLQERGAVEAMISLVALLATSEAVAKVHAAFPGVKIVTAQVDNGGDGPMGEEMAPVEEGVTRVRASTTDMILDRLEQVYHGYSPAVTY